MRSASWSPRRPEGYEERTATRAAHALEILDEYLSDLIVMDIRMPDMDGIEAMGRMLNWKNDNLCAWPASAYIVKSSDTGELTGTVRRLLHDSQAA